MDLFFVLLVLLVATHAFGEIAERLGQPGLAARAAGLTSQEAAAVGAVAE